MNTMVGVVEVKSALIITIGIGLYSGLAIVGQAVDQLPVAGTASWLTFFVQAGSFGLLAYLIVLGLPALQKELKAERKEERTDFTAALKVVTDDRRLERQDFAAVVKVITDAARTEVEMIRTAAREEVDRLQQVFQQEQRETRKMYIDAVGAMRTAVHDVRDVAQATVNKASVAMEVAKNRPPTG